MIGFVLLVVNDDHHNGMADDATGGDQPCREDDEWLWIPKCGNQEDERTGKQDGECSNGLLTFLVPVEFERVHLIMVC